MNPDQNTSPSSSSTKVRALGCTLSLAAAFLPGRSGFTSEPAQIAAPAAVVTREKDPGATVLTEDQITRRVQDLGSDTFAVREQATHVLIAAGAPVLGAIELARQSRDAEVAVRASRIEDAIRRPLLSAPSVVNLHMIDTPVSSILSEIERQTGNQIEVGVLDDTPISVSFSKTQFWKALIAICEKSGNTIMDDDGPTGWRIEENIFRAEWFDSDGPFLVKKSSQMQIWSPTEPLPAPLPGGLPLPPKATPGVGCMFYIFCEPRVALDGFISEATALRSSTDVGERLLAVANNQPMYRSTRLAGREENRCMTSVSWPKLPAHSVSGDFVVQTYIHGNSERVRLPATTQEPFQIGNGRLSLLNSRQLPTGTFEYNLADTLSPEEGIREVLCFDENGRRIAARLHEGHTVIAGKDCIRMQVQVDQQPATFEYRVHRFSFQAGWKFSFQNFSMPQEAQNGNLP